MGFPRVTIGTATVPPVIVAVAAAASLYWWAVFATTITALGPITVNIPGPGMDWMVFHHAIQAVLNGQATLLGDGDRFTASVNATYSDWLNPALAYCPWLNPPSFLVLLLPFGVLGFLSSYLLFQVLGIVALAAALRGITREADWTVCLAVLLSPAVAVAVLIGQSALLVAALLIAGLRLAPTRPIMGGLLLGLMTFKPQFALLVPVALVAARQWRALGAAAAGGAGLALASLVLWGAEPWQSWLGQTVGSMFDPGSKWAEIGRLWGNSVYASAVMGGIPRWVASLAQAGATAGSAIAVYALFASRALQKDKIAGLCLATILAAPHSGFYDLVLVTAATCLSMADREPKRDQLWPWMIPLIFWVAPCFTPPALHTVGCLLPLLLAAVLWRQVAGHRSLRAMPGAVAAS